MAITMEDLSTLKETRKMGVILRIQFLRR